MAIDSREAVEAAVAARLSEDPELRARFIAHPREVLEEITGMTIPEAVRITVHEETLTNVHFVLPPQAHSELSEDDLSLVAGGWNGQPLGAC